MFGHPMFASFIHAAHACSINTPCKHFHRYTIEFCSMTHRPTFRLQCSPHINSSTFRGSFFHQYGRATTVPHWPWYHGVSKNVVNPLLLQRMCAASWPILTLPHFAVDAAMVTVGRLIMLRKLVLPQFSFWHEQHVARTIRATSVPHTIIAIATRVRGTAAESQSASRNVVWEMWCISPLLGICATTDNFWCAGDTFS